MKSRPQWLGGPQTITVKMRDGTEVTVQGGDQPMIEAEARVVDGTPVQFED